MQVLRTCHAFVVLYIECFLVGVGLCAFKPPLRLFVMVGCWRYVDTSSPTENPALDTSLRASVRSLADGIVSCQGPLPSSCCKR